MLKIRRNNSKNAPPPLPEPAPPADVYEDDIELLDEEDEDTFPTDLLQMVGLAADTLRALCRAPVDFTEGAMAVVVAAVSRSRST